MLEIKVSTGELFDEETLTFITPKEQTLRLEHSLVSLSKWESKWCKPFLGKEPMTREEELDYIRCMTVTQNVDSDIYNYLSNEQFIQIRDYINAPMTATTFNEPKDNKINKEQITAELVYYWMIALNIPVEFQKWHFNKLLTLIKVCNIKNQPPKKMGKHETMSRNARLNAARRKQLNTRG